MKVFLGGTCNSSTWRGIIKPKLRVAYFGPVVDEWTEKCVAEELRQRDVCDYCLYLITPDISGVYSIAEVIDDSNKRPEKTIFCFTAECSSQLFTYTQERSLQQVGKMVTDNGGVFLISLADVIQYLNKKGEESE